ncbi:MAG: hypothetical protein PHS53_03135 [Candidatus Pacebacteria bacterium]|nr:hypothetical protein [Candidatus Paceibacterota bacterium]MDD5357112.1 hypothetical protein [Candidatus Paceibacterota bacterium]
MLVVIHCPDVKESGTAARGIEEAMILSLQLERAFSSRGYYETLRLKRKGRKHLLRGCLLFPWNLGVGVRTLGMFLAQSIKIKYLPFMLPPTSLCEIGGERVLRRIAAMPFDRYDPLVLIVDKEYANSFPSDLIASHGMPVPTRKLMSGEGIIIDTDLWDWKPLGPY